MIVGFVTVDGTVICDKAALLSTITSCGFAGFTVTCVCEFSTRSWFGVRFLAGVMELSIFIDSCSDKLTDLVFSMVSDSPSESDSARLSDFVVDTVSDRPSESESDLVNDLVVEIVSESPSESDSDTVNNLRLVVEMVSDRPSESDNVL